MTAYDNLVLQLQTGRATPNGIMAICPAHEDRSPSMLVSQRDDKVLLHCYAGCETDTILESLGLDWSALFDGPPPERPQIRDELIESYVYVRPDGEPHLIVERWRKAEGGKSFKQKRPTGEYGLGDVKPCLYRMDKITGHEGVVWVVEGERDVHTAERHGLVATTCPMGAGKWRDYYSNWLSSASIVMIVADNDEPGRKHAAQVAAALDKAGIKHKTWRAREGKDLTDHLDYYGYGIGELVPFNPNRKRGAGLEHKALLEKEHSPLNWCIPGLLPSGLALLGGPPKISKSYMALDIALGVAFGQRALSELPCEQGSVLYLSLDNDSERRLQTRVLDLMQGQIVSAPIEYHTEWPTGVEALAHCREWMAETENPKLIVLDTLVRVEPDMDREGGAYSNSVNCLSRWADLATQNNITVLAVHHDRKAPLEKDEDWLNRFTGSRGITATAQTLMFLDAKRGEKEGKLRVTGRDQDTEDIELHYIRPVWTAVSMPTGTTREYL